MANEWNYNVNEAPKGEVVWLTLEYDDAQLEVLKCMIDELTDGLKVRAWKQVECWPEPAGTPPKPEQVKGWQEGGLVVFDSAVTPIFCDSAIEMIQMVEKRTREIVEWERRYGK